MSCERKLLVNELEIHVQKNELRYLFTAEFHFHL